MSGRWSASVAILVLVVAAAGCGTPAGGDPGNRRLHELAGDAVFAAYPTSATAIRVIRTRARYVHPAFQGAGWDGPSVVVTFTSTAPVAVVFRFYAQRAGAAGWQATAKGSFDLTDVWKKTYTDSAPATLLLSPLGPTSSAGQRWSLAGGVGLANS